MIDTAAKIGIAALIGAVAFAVFVPKHKAIQERAPVVIAEPAPTPSEPTVFTVTIAHEPTWADAVPEFASYKPVPLPPVKKHRRHRRHVPLCVTPLVQP